MSDPKDLISPQTSALGTPDFALHAAPAFDGIGAEMLRLRSDHSLNLSWLLHYERTMEELTEIKYALQIEDHKHQAFQNLMMKEHADRLLRAGSFSKGSSLAIRGRAKEPLTAAEEKRLRHAWSELVAQTTPGGLAKRIVDTVGVGSIIPRSQILGITGCAPQLIESVIGDLCRHGCLKKMQRIVRSSEACYEVTGQLHYHTITERFLRRHAFEIGRSIKNASLVSEWAIGTVPICPAGLVRVRNFMRSKLLEDLTGLMQFHTGGRPNYGRMLALVPTAAIYKCPKEPIARAQLAVGEALLRFDESIGFFDVSCAELSDLKATEVRAAAGQSFTKAMRILDQDEFCSSAETAEEYTAVQIIAPLCIPL